MTAHVIGDNSPTRGSLGIVHCREYGAMGHFTCGHGIAQSHIGTCIVKSADVMNPT